MYQCINVFNPEEVNLSHSVVESCIGKGGFCKVLAVLHKGTGVQMAMKRLTKNKMVGKDLSHSVVESCIGKGGFCKVLAVLHKGTGVQMAMKRLTKNKMVGKDWHCNAVWTERNLLELLQSPYTNRLYFAFQRPCELLLMKPYNRGELLLVKPYNRFLDDFDTYGVERKFIGLKVQEKDMDVIRSRRRISFCFWE
eukprot:729967_1